jgi:hypothetical protein
MAIIGVDPEQWIVGQQARRALDGQLTVVVIELVIDDLTDYRVDHLLDYGFEIAAPRPC